jgi:8-oxo-dGTP pyrophosphatase MutT (NUDIX family)
MGKTSKQAKKAKGRVQYAALPFRLVGGGVEILLITSRETRRWVVPKGWPMKGLSPSAAAAREALEEAGIEGSVAEHAIGAFTYRKRLRDGTSVDLLVDVFPLQVATERAQWPEKDQRERRWFRTDEAAEAVAEPELARLIRGFGLAHAIPQSPSRA